MFEDHRVGIVYSDIEYLGAPPGRTFVPEFDGDVLERDDYIHGGALVRRRALEITDAYREGPTNPAHSSWLAWRRVVEGGWRAAKQPALYSPWEYPLGRIRPPETLEPPYFERASLAAAAVTIFTPLSGRTSLWKAYSDWLLAQTWPREQCSLFLMDTSGDIHFGRLARQFLASCDYPDVRYSAHVVAEAGLADQPRRERLGDVRLACARIYNRMARAVSTPYVLVVEDDIIPPPELIDRLLRSFDAQTAAVAAPYRSRLHDAYVVWDDRGFNLFGGDGVQSVTGTGFGCIAIRN